VPCAICLTTTAASQPQHLSVAHRFGTHEIQRVLQREKAPHPCSPSGSNLDEELLGLYAQLRSERFRPMSWCSAKRRATGERDPAQLPDHYREAPGSKVHAWPIAARRCGALAAFGEGPGIAIDARPQAFRETFLALSHQCKGNHFVRIPFYHRGTKTQEDRKSCLKQDNRWLASLFFFSVSLASVVKF